MVVNKRQNQESAMQKEYEALSEDEKRQRREDLLTGLIEDFAIKEGETVDKENPFREKANSELIKAIAKRAAIKVGIGVLFAGATVMFGGVPLVAAASVMGSGLATSSLARGGVDAWRKLGGAEGKENEIQKRLAEIHKQRQIKLIKLANDVKNAENLQLVEKGEHISQIEARRRFIEYVVDISNPENEENKAFEADKEKLLKSKKKWRWIKFGASMTAGILAGGVVAEAFKDEIKSVVANKGFDMAGEGLGKIGDLAGIANDASHHNVHELADGHTVFDYNPGELAKLQGVADKQPYDFSVMFDSANTAMHGVGDKATEAFHEIVIQKANDHVVDLWGAVAGNMAVNELVDNFEQGDFAMSVDQRRIKSNEIEASRLAGDINQDLILKNYERVTRGSAEYPSFGAELSLLKLAQQKYKDGETDVIHTFNPGEKFRFLTFGNGAFILEPINDELNKRSDRGQIRLNKESFDSMFIPPASAPESAGTSVTGLEELGQSAEETSQAEIVPQESIIANNDKGETETAETEPETAQPEPEKPKEIEFDDIFKRGAVWFGKRDGTYILGKAVGSPSDSEQTQIRLKQGEELSVVGLVDDKINDVWLIHFAKKKYSGTPIIYEAEISRFLNYADPKELFDIKDQDNYKKAEGQLEIFATEYLKELHKQQQEVPIETKLEPETDPTGESKELGKPEVAERKTGEEQAEEEDSPKAEPAEQETPIESTTPPEPATEPEPEPTFSEPAEALKTSETIKNKLIVRDVNGSDREIKPNQTWLFDDKGDTLSSLVTSIKYDKDGNPVDVELDGELGEFENIDEMNEFFSRGYILQ